MVRKMILIASVGLLLTTATAYAHIAGVFKDFLWGANQDTFEQLKQQIDQSKQDMAQISIKVDQQKQEYDQKADKAVSLIQFYRSIGLDAYFKFISGSGDIVDVLANRQLLALKMQEDLKGIEDLYLAYMSLKTAETSLQDYKDLLRIIEGNLEARNRLTESNPGLTSEQLGNIAFTQWNAHAADLVASIRADSELLNGHLKEVVTRQSPQSPYRIDEGLFNKRAKLTYFFRSDHIYVHYQKEDADVVLLGEVSKIGPKIASLQFEAGYMNGIEIQDQYLAFQLPGMKIDYGLLEPDSDSFYADQVDGALVLQPAENAVE
ncbi:MAG: hypothetical protein K0R75_3962 [Paenibacillaceae bacterium]|jgi:hypothetical protein|nr:hypothetical protein [Paenibacillaceae bacterium]